MKRKIYPISLLLLFLVVLTHDMIPHHHHDYDLDDFSNFNNHHLEYAHHKAAGHHHHDGDNQKHNHSNDSEKEHNHTFPLHHHISPTNGFDYLRNEFTGIIVFHLPFLAVLNSFFNTTLPEPPELDFIRFTDKPFLISAFFKPGAIGLRAPPSIA